VRRLRLALGTWLALEASGPSAEGAGRAIEAACAAVAEVETHMHPGRPGSDLQRLRDACPRVEIPIHFLTWQVLSFAQRLHQLTDGIFDPSLPDEPGTLRDLQLRCDGFEAGPSETAHRPACHASTRAPLALDLGGIAKGFAVDCAVAALQAAGCSAGLVNAGGDLRVFGPLPAYVLLRGPDGHFQPRWLHDAALAVSDLDSEGRPAQHRGYYVRSGLPRGAQRYAAVVARDAMSADALTKCVLLCPGERAQQVLSQCGARAAA
jgi:thiamine biosynthesis lipoprotein